MIKNVFSALALLAAGCAAAVAQYVDWVDWSRVRHWAGDPAGENKCALVVDFQDGHSNRACVWGYRWSGTATGEDLVRAVASQSSILTAMIQYTGTMGSTLDALGISARREELDRLVYDFPAAAAAPEISFGFYAPNMAMGQDGAPGDSAPDDCLDAIEAARTTGIIEHPLNAFVFGYPAYDYDYWQLDGGSSYDRRWRSGWYEGYWSYWHGPNDYDYMAYSGLGMSSTMLADGTVQAWKYTPLNGGEGFGATGGEMALELDYDMDDWGEEMHPAAAAPQPVDHGNIEYWVGDGEKAAAVVLQFADGRGPDNLVYGYRWSGGWDDNLATVVARIAAADPRLRLDTGAAGGYTMAYDADADGAIGEMDHAPAGCTMYVRRTVDRTFNAVAAGRWLNPGAVLVLGADGAPAPSGLPCQLMRPAPDSERVLSIPAAIDYTLSDTPLQIPIFATVPEGATLSTAFTWTRPAMLSRINTHMFMGTVSSYRDFAPGEAEVAVRGSYVPAGSTEARSAESNACRITFHEPERPLTGIFFENEEFEMGLRATAVNPVVKLPADATYTALVFRSSDPSIVSVNAATGELTTFGRSGAATVTATYVADPAVAAECTVLVGPESALAFVEAPEPSVAVAGNVLTATNMEGIAIAVVDLAGHAVLSFTPATDREETALTLPAGIYILTARNMPAKKIVIK